MSTVSILGQAALSALLLSGIIPPVSAQALIPAEEVGDIMGQYFCLETTGQLPPEEVNSLVEQDLVSVYGAPGRARRRYQHRPGGSLRL